MKKVEKRYTNYKIPQCIRYSVLIGLLHSINLVILAHHLLYEFVPVHDSMISVSL